MVSGKELRLYCLQYISKDYIVVSLFYRLIATKKEKRYISFFVHLSSYEILAPDYKTTVMTQRSISSIKINSDAFASVNCYTLTAQTSERYFRVILLLAAKTILNIAPERAILWTGYVTREILYSPSHDVNHNFSILYLPRCLRKRH